MFSGRVPDHLLQVGAVLNAAAAFDAIVENQEPLKTILARLHTDTPLDQRTEYNSNGPLGVHRTPQPFGRVH